MLVVVADRVRHVARLGQFDLLLPVDGAAAGFLDQRIPAMRAADASNVMLAGAIFNTDRCAAGMTLIVVAFAEVVTHGHAVVEHEAVALPLGFFLRHLFEVLQDATLEVVNLFETLDIPVIDMGDVEFALMK